MNALKLLFCPENGRKVHTSFETKYIETKYIETIQTKTKIHESGKFQKMKPSL
jgi:hypothetical protein